MRFSILAHACMQVEADGKSLVCDPWLTGSAYWGSWWNYPPVSKHIFERLNPDFIFITHLHWDHFHGPWTGPNHTDPQGSRDTSSRRSLGNGIQEGH